MVAADALAIAGGALAGKHLPENVIKIGAGYLFLLFGGWMLAESAFPQVSVALITLGAVAVAAWSAGYGPGCVADSPLADQLRTLLRIRYPSGHRFPVLRPGRDKELRTMKRIGSVYCERRNLTMPEGNLESTATGRWI